MKMTITGTAAVLLLAAAASSHAQMRPAEWPVSDLEIGYSYLRDDTIEIGDVGSGFPLGWQASASWNARPAIGLVADASGHYKSEDLVPGSGDSGLKFRVHALHVGPRFTGRGTLRPYAQLLAGITRNTMGVSGVDTSQSDFSLQPGVGLMVPLGEDISLGLGVDYRIVFSELEKAKQLRAHAGIVFNLY